MKLNKFYFIGKIMKYTPQAGCRRKMVLASQPFVSDRKAGWELIL